MNGNDYEGFHEGVAGVYAFYGRDLSRFALDVWWNALKGYDLPTVTEAFNRWLVNTDSGQFLPKPADVLKMLGGTSNDRAMQAWSKIDRAVRHVGTHRSVVFDDPLIHRVLHEMGGWIALGTKSESDWPFVAKEFENRYRGYAMRGERPEYPPVLIGIAEAHNAKGNFRVESPMLIGSPDRARLVRQGGIRNTVVGFISADSYAESNVVNIGCARRDAA